MKTKILTFITTVAVCWTAAALAQTVPLSGLTATWNDGGTDFDAISMTVTNTASGAGSNFLYLTDGTNTTAVDKWGNVVWAEKAAVGATPAAGFGYLWTKNTVPSTLIFTDDAGTDFTLGSGGGLTNWEESGTTLRPTTAGFDLGDATNELGDIYMADSKSLILGSAQDLYLTRDAANVLAQRNGVSAQTFNIYNTYTDASNYERGFLKWNTNTLEVGTEAAGTGSQRALKFDGLSISFWTAGTQRFNLNSTQLQGNTTGSGALYNIAASATGASLLPNKSDLDTGIGSAGVDQLSLIAGGVEVARAVEDTGNALMLATGQTVAGLPVTPAVGMIARVTDALTPSLGATVTGGGAEDALVWYDGAAWVVVSGESGIGGGGGLANVVEDTTPQLGGQLDVNGQSLGDGTLELLSFSETASAVNEFTIANAATGNGPTLSATGSDTDVPINITPKGAGAIRLNGKTAYPFGGAISLTGGVTTVTDSYHEVTSQSGPSDDLDTLNGGVDGMIVILHPTSGDTITVKDGTGNIKTATDFAMNAIEDSIMLIYSSAQSAWIEISRSDNG
jgi:hypothetical protein